MNPIDSLYIEYDTRTPEAEDTKRVLLAEKDPLHGVFGDFFAETETHSQTLEQHHTSSSV
jgi:hypothetical protein